MSRQSRNQSDGVRAWRWVSMETDCQVFLFSSACRLQTWEKWNGLLRECPKRSTAEKLRDKTQTILRWRVLLYFLLFVLVNVFSTSILHVLCYSFQSTLYFHLHADNLSLTCTIETLTIFKPCINASPWLLKIEEKKKWERSLILKGSPSVTDLVQRVKERGG